MFEPAARKAQAPGRADEQDASPSERMLMAIEMIGLRGPLTYKELERALRLSKAATWRIVATLREANWVCFRQNGRLIALDPRVDEFFARTGRRPRGNGAMYLKSAVILATFFASYVVLVFFAANWWHAWVSTRTTAGRPSTRSCLARKR